MKKLLLTTAAVLCLATAAHGMKSERDFIAAATQQHTDNWPAVLVNTLTYGHEFTLTEDGCKNYALDVLNRAGLHSPSVTGSSVWSIATEQDNDYSVGVWYQIETDNKFVVLIVAGKTMDNTGKIMGLLEDVWNGDKKSVND